MIQNSKRGRHVPRVCPGQQRGAFRLDHGGDVSRPGGRTSCDPAGDSLTPGCRKVIAAGNKVVDGVRLERFTRLHWPAMQNQLQRGFRPHPVPGPDRSAIAGKKAEIDLGKPDLAGRVVDGDDPVEGQRQFEPAPDADPVDQDDAGAVQPLDCGETCQHIGDMGLDFGGACEQGKFIDVRTEYEAARLCRGKDEPGRRARHNLVDCLDQLGHHFLREHIDRAALGVHRQAGNSGIIKAQLEMGVIGQIRLPGVSRKIPGPADRPTSYLPRPLRQGVSPPGRRIRQSHEFGNLPPVFQPHHP